MLDTFKVLKPITAFAVGVGNTNQAAAAFLALAADVAIPTLTNGELLIANGSNLPAIVFVGLGGW